MQGRGTSTVMHHPLGDGVLKGMDFDMESPSRYDDDIVRNQTSPYMPTRSIQVVGGRIYMLGCSSRARDATTLGVGLFEFRCPVGAILQVNSTGTSSASSRPETGAWRAHRICGWWHCRIVYLGLLAAALDVADSRFIDADTHLSQVLLWLEGASN